MLTTTEMRWFYPGTLPGEIRDWFVSDTLGKYVTSPEKREDIYLYLPNCKYMGIKLRQKRIEIKLRKSELGVLSFGDRYQGKAEKWIKWSCEDPANESLISPDAMAKAPWLTVEKLRWQHLYQVSKDTPLKTLPVDEKFSQGCYVEITQINITDKVWWSMAFEVFSQEGKLLENLKNVADFVFQSYPGADLKVENSYAYPKWLSLVN
ncbi:MAG TPA: hypothetical protein V6D28_14780 [Leptolyngbyaceae cyanobacterium]